MNSELAWVLVSSGAQVQPQMNSIQTTFQIIFPFLMTMERTRMDWEEEQELEITLPQVERRRSVFPTGNRGIQRQMEKLSEDIQEVKGEMKKISRSGVQT